MRRSEPRHPEQLVSMLVTTVISVLLVKTLFKGFSWINMRQGIQRLPSFLTDKEIETQ